jgi:hypothetical protein
MAELFGKGKVAVLVMFFAFSRTLGAVGIVIGNFGHGTSPESMH